METRATTHDWRGLVAAQAVTFNGALATELAYDYTVEGWLTEETRTTYASGTPTTSVRSHAYDDAGNRLSTTVDSTVEHTWTYDEGNLLATLDGGAVEFNPQGELEVDPRGYEIIRAPDGRESWVGDSGVGYTIFRDPDGNPIAVDDGTDTRLQGWGNPGVDLPMHLGELGGSTEAVVGIEGVQLGRWSSSAGYTPVATDALGSVVLDGSTFVGIPEAFGEDAGSGGVGNQRHVYAGLEVLPGLPFQLARARMMDGTVGRFTSVDPIGLQGGDHRFVYAENQPTGFVDPGGLRAGNRGDGTDRGGETAVYLGGGSNFGSPPQGVYTGGLAVEGSLAALGARLDATKMANNMISVLSRQGARETDTKAEAGKPGEEPKEEPSGDEPEAESLADREVVCVGGVCVDITDLPGDDKRPKPGEDDDAEGEDEGPRLEPTDAEAAVCWALDSPLARKLSLGYSMRGGAPLELTPDELETLAYFPTDKLSPIIRAQVKAGHSTVQDYRNPGHPLEVGGAIDTNIGGTTNETGIEVIGEAEEDPAGELHFDGRFRVFESLDFDNFTSPDGSWQRDALTAIGKALMHDGEPYMITSPWYPLTIDGPQWRTTMPGFGGRSSGGPDSPGAKLAFTILPVSDTIAGLAIGARGGAKLSLSVGALGGAGGIATAYQFAAWRGASCATETLKKHQPGGEWNAGR